MVEGTQCTHTHTQTIGNARALPIAPQTEDQYNKCYEDGTGSSGETYLSGFLKAIEVTFLHRTYVRKCFAEAYAHVRTYAHEGEALI